MASNKQKQAKKTNQVSAKKEEKRNKLAAIIALIILILLLLLGFWAAANDYGPWADKDTASDTSKDGSSKKSTKDKKSSSSKNTGSSSSGGGSTSGSNGSNGSSGTNGSNGSNGSNGNTPSTPTTPASNDDALINLSGGINNGDTKEQVSAKSKGVNSSCTITAKTATTGKSEVCTYKQGSKTVKVTYLNDRVVNVDRSGL